MNITNDKVGSKNNLLELKKDEYNKWTIPQFKNVLFLRKYAKDRILPTTKKDLIKLWIEWESKLEANWNFVKEYCLKKNSNISTHIN